MTEECQNDVPEEVEKLLDEIYEASIEDELVLVRGINSDSGKPVFLLCRAQKNGDSCEIAALAEIPEGGPGENVVLPRPFEPLRRELH